jgi:hypothetical protein
MDRFSSYQLARQLKFQIHTIGNNQWVMKNALNTFLNNLIALKTAAK